MLSLGLYLLLMLNPVALFLYLKPLIKDGSFADYMNVVRKATAIAWGVYAVFVLTGDALFTEVFQIDFNSFRLFGWIIVAGFAMSYLLHGKESFIHMRGDLNDVAQQLALPFMVGAGSISVSVLIGHQYPGREGIAILIGVLCVCMLCLLAFRCIRRYVFIGVARKQFDRFLTIAFRLNSFMMGAVGLDMIVTGIKLLFLS